MTLRLSPVAAAAAAALACCVAPAPASALVSRGVVVLHPELSMIGTAIARAPGGKLVVAGDTNVDGGFGVVRLSSRGVPERRFGSGGVGRAGIGRQPREDDLTGLVVLPGGRILVSGEVVGNDSQGQTYGAASFLARGALDRTVRFTAGGGNDSPEWMARMPDGRILVGGGGPPEASGISTMAGCALSFDASFAPTPGYARPCVTPPGMLDALFGAGAPDAGNTTVVSVAGHGPQGPGGEPIELGIGRLTADGHVDTSFGSGGFTTVPFERTHETLSQIGRFPLVHRPGGGWIAGGTGSTTFAFAGFTAQGAVDPSFGAGGRLTVNADGTRFRDVLTDLVPVRGGKFVAVGMTETNTAPARLLLARITAAGRLDRSFGRGGRVVLSARQLGLPALAQVNAAVAEPDGSVVVTGAARGTFHGRPRYGLLLVHFTPGGRIDRRFGR